MNSISPSDLDKVLLSNDPSQAETLSYRGVDAICFDGIDLKTSQIVDNIVLDFIRKDQELGCLDEVNCQEILQALVCVAGNPIKNLDSMSVYCAVEVMKVDGKKLVESDVKKAARQAARQAEKAIEDAKELARKQSLQDLKDLSPLPDPVGTTVAQLRAELKDAVNRANKLRAILKDVIKEQ
jgi:hypothetical protein